MKLEAGVRFVRVVISLVGDAVKLCSNLAKSFFFAAT